MFHNRYYNIWDHQNTTGRSHMSCYSLYQQLVLLSWYSCIGLMGTSLVCCLHGDQPLYILVHCPGRYTACSQIWRSFPPKWIYLYTDNLETNAKKHRRSQLQSFCTAIIWSANIPYKKLFQSEEQFDEGSARNNGMWITSGKLDSKTIAFICPDTFVLKLTETREHTLKYLCNMLGSTGHVACDTRFRLCMLESHSDCVCFCRASRVSRGDNIGQTGCRTLIQVYIEALGKFENRKAHCGLLHILLPEVKYKLQAGTPCCSEIRQGVMHCVTVIMYTSTWLTCWFVRCINIRNDLKVLIIMFLSISISSL